MSLHVRSFCCRLKVCRIHQLQDGRVLGGLTVIMRVFAPIRVMAPIRVTAPGCDKYPMRKHSKNDRTPVRKKRSHPRANTRMITVLCT